METTYRPPIQTAYKEFCDKWLLCSFTKDGVQCVNVRSSHKKGHQSSSGNVLARSGFELSFDEQDFFACWIRKVDEHIDGLNRRLHESSTMARGEMTRVVRLHQKVMSDFYNEVGKGSWVGNLSHLKSHVTCLCCVRKIPEHVLPCGHVLCGECIRSLGTDEGLGLFSMRGCPLHPYGTTPWTVRIRFKPKEAGIRILCLDG